ncbi:hypothetical protein YQE_11992, partial [Dendroctonus ponderosae]
MNLTFPSDPQQPSPQQGGVQQIQSPAMSMPGQGGNPGYPPHMQIRRNSF